jgi:hypothetical protein
MPSKGKNRASRQSQLRNKRKKSSTKVVDSRPQAKESPIKNEPSSNSEFTKTTSEEIDVLSKKTSSSTMSSLTYPYIKGELLRISSASLIIIIILISFTFISLD